MLRSTVSKAEQGFTLLELMIVLVLAGILSALSAPSLLRLYNQNQVANAFNDVRGALQEAQRLAMSKSQDCTVTIASTSVTSTGGCLYSDRTLPDGIEIETNLSPSEVTFNFRGGTGSGGTIVLYTPDSSTAKQKCIVVSAGIGLIRTGDYSGTVPGTINSANCTN